MIQEPCFVHLPRSVIANCPCTASLFASGAVRSTIKQRCILNLENGLIQVQRPTRLPHPTRGYVRNRETANAELNATGPGFDANRYATFTPGKFHGELSFSHSGVFSHLMEIGSC